MGGRVLEKLKHFEFKLLKDKWKSFGWNCFEINGHNFNQIQKYLKKKITNQPQ